MAGSKGKGSRAGYQKRQKFSLSDLLDSAKDLPNNYNDLVSAYRTLAKAADQRLVRLERYAKDPEYGHATQWAYARAQRDIKEWSGEGAARFNTAPPAREGEVRKKIEDIRTFLRSSTSTKKGIKETLQKRADTLNKDWGTKFKWDDVGKFFDSKLNEKLRRDYGSKTVMRILARLQRTSKDIIKTLEATSKADIRTPDASTMVDKMVNNALKKYGSEILEYLK